MTTTTALLLLLALPAQSAQIPAPPQAAPIAIVDVAIHPVSSPAIGRGWLLLDEGRIAAMGEGDPPALPANAETVDGRGLHAWPGLISASSQVGLVETLAVDVTDDRSELGRFTPEARAAVAVNPDSDLIPVTRAAGILLAGVFPQGGLVSGRPSVMRLDGWTWESMAADDAYGLLVQWPLVTPVTGGFVRTSAEEQRTRSREQREEIERFFDDAAAYVALRDADPAQATDQRYEAMREVLAGREPVFLVANGAAEIETAVAFALRRALRPVIVGGAEADRVLPLLAEHRVPVVLGGVHRLPLRRDDPVDRPFALPARLHEAGIPFAISCGEEPAHERNLPQHVATAVAHGLPHEAGMRSITLAAAEILGVAGDYGSLEPGKSATLILVAGPELAPGAGAGDPLETTTEVVAAFLDGRRLDLGSRHRRLYEKYREKYRQLGELEPAR